MEIKFCKFCNTDKKIIDFTFEKRCKNGRSNICFDCKNQKSKEYRDSEKGKIKNKEYRINNREKWIERYKENYCTDEHRKKAVNKSRIYYENNKDKYNKYQRKIRSEQISSLKDSYIKDRLRGQGFKTNQITPELIELKRITLKTKRLCHQLKN